MATGYEDIDNLMTEQNQYLEQEKQLNNQIIDTGLQKTQNEVNWQKQDYDEEAQKNAKALYADYKKQSSPYGANSEQMAANGLNNSGYAESSQVSLYNNYQKNVTELINNTAKLKAEADRTMTQAYLDADIQKAQNTLSTYEQKAQLALTEYEYKYQRDRDAVSDSQWQQQFDLSNKQFKWQQNTWQQEFEYQKQRDAIADSQWERQYQLSLQSLKQ